MRLATKIFIRLLIYLYVGLTSAPAFSSKSIVIASSEGVPYTGKALRFGGYVNHILRHIYEQQGYEVRIEFLNWSRARQLTDEGAYHLASYVYADPKHTDKFLLSDIVTLEQLVFLHHHSFSMPQWQSLSELKRARLGLTRGYTYTPEIWEYAQSHQRDLSVVNTDQQNIAMLMKRRIDIFPVGKLQGVHLLEMADSETRRQLIFDNKPIGIMQGKVLFPKSRPDAQELLQILNSGLTEMSQNGQMKHFADALARGFYSRELRQHVRERSGDD